MPKKIKIGFLPKGSILRYLVGRLAFALILFLCIDFLLTWFISRQSHLSDWSVGDLFVLMIISQIFIVGGFAALVYFGVRSGLRTVRQLSQEIAERNADDLQPIDTANVPTELQPVIARLNDLLGRLDESLLAQKRFIGNAAHQLRTPLTGLRMESELMLAKDDLPEDIQARVQRIHQVSNRLIHLGEQLLALARADYRLHPRDSFKQLDLVALAENLGSEWFLKLREQKIDLVFEAPEQAVMIDGSEILLEELLSNLLDNALKYAKGANKIILQVKQNPPSLLIEDNGCGVAHEEREMIFDTFVRSASSPSGLGTGLGLSIVREIARAHGAGWSLVSRPDIQGTRVMVVFPGPRIGTGLRRLPKPVKSMPSLSDVTADH
ncbi:MAG: HAMP domain-containing sensor histidine kinase [Pelistega sp.]|nr:HAMP domain-containing sensor histidine kinase [Pelistega sp.]